MMLRREGTETVKFFRGRLGGVGAHEIEGEFAGFGLRENLRVSLFVGVGRNDRVACGGQLIAQE